MSDKFDLILADPPWSYKVWSKKGIGRTAESHYPTLNLSQICSIPVKEIASDNCALFLWATFPNLQESFEVIKAWGFRFCTVAFVWVKLNKKSPGYFTGLGYWTRSNSEICLLGMRGHPKRVSKSVKQIIASPRGRHSEKPAEVRTRIVELMGDLPRIELFAREKTEGWKVWGNEVENDIILDVRG